MIVKGIAVFYSQYLSARHYHPFIYEENLVMGRMFHLWFGESGEAQD